MKLTGSINITNMVGFNKDRKINKYNSTKEIMEEFYGVRLNFYDKRKEYLLSKL